MFDIFINLFHGIEKFPFDISTSRIQKLVITTVEMNVDNQKNSRYYIFSRETKIIINTQALKAPCLLRINILKGLSLSH